jgi:hypothetical protein
MTRYVEELAERLGGPPARRAAWRRPTMIEIEAVAVVNA